MNSGIYTITNLIDNKIYIGYALKQLLKNLNGNINEKEKKDKTSEERS